VGHAYALVADAVESTADIFSSLVVDAGLRIAAQPAD
jgi:divalent metal cation (Fe/Co/Zn/Cd) transporter